jgi:tellurite resistance protein
MLESLHELPTAELQALFGLVEGPAGAPRRAADRTELERAFLDRLVALSGFEAKAGVEQEERLEGLERHLATHAANLLGVDYGGEMSAREIFDLWLEEIAARIVSEMEPFVAVSVCMGWADGRLSPEEIEVLDRALSQLQLIRSHRSELLDLCKQPLAPSQLEDTLNALASDETRAWAVLALGWSIAMADRVTTDEEVRAHNELAAYLGVGSAHAAEIRSLVEKRFVTLTGDSGEAPGGRWHDVAEAAVTAAGLEHYLRAATGLQKISQTAKSFAAKGRASTAHTDWILAPALVAGAVFLRGVGRSDADRRLLVALAALAELTGG